MEDYKEKYENALEIARKINNGDGVPAPPDYTICEVIFPELKESVDEKIRKALIHSISEQDGFLTAIDGISVKDIIAWLENQDPKKHEEEIEDAYKCVDEVQYRRGYEDAKREFKKQCEQQNKVFIWKHWKDGIAGNGEDKPIFLIKNGDTYSLSSCLGYECDYIELSELNKLLSNKKQNEQKPADKVEPKFHEGEWVVENMDASTWLITRVFTTKENVTAYNMINQEGRTLLIGSHNIDYHFNLWTIKDAKDSDILAASDGSIFIFKEVVDCGCKHYIALEKDNETINVNNNLKHFWEAASGVKPATKEQRELLFQKMKEAGYEWDSEKKELKKIEQLPAWSEEDEKFFKTALWHISYSVSNGKRTDEHCDTTDWLKSVKERLKSMRPQSHKWYIKKGHWYMCIVDKPEYGWTKGKVYQSPEDNRIETDYGGDLTNWPDSEPWFRPATTNEIPNPQPHWKPSDEQMDNK